MPSPPNPGDPVVPLADAARILTGYGVSSGAYTFEDAHRDINAAAVPWPAPPTGHTTIRTDDLALAIELLSDGAYYRVRRDLVARLRAALPQPGEPC